MIVVPVVLTNRVEHDDVEGEAEVVVALPALRLRDPVLLLPIGGGGTVRPFA
jgi:hypothetical protein